MKGFLMRAVAAVRRFMLGRYGFDELSAAIMLLACVLSFLSGFRVLRYFYFVSIALMAVAVWRALSKNIVKRCNERYKFLQLIEKPKAELRFLSNKIKDRKTHKYFRCKSCGASLRVPKGKGKIKVTCPKCGVKVQKKT